MEGEKFNKREEEEEEEGSELRINNYECNYIDFVIHGSAVNDCY